MKKFFVTMIAVVTITGFSSCVTSLQPLATIDKMVTDARIAGSWGSKEGDFSITGIASSAYAKELKDFLGKEENRKEKLTGEARLDSIRTSKMYIVTYDRDGVQYNLAASLVKLGDHFFADLHPLAMRDPAEKAGEEDPFGFDNDYLPGYTIAKVEFMGESEIRLSFVDGEFIKEQVTAGRMRIRYESDPLFGTFMITASSVELQQFLHKYATDPNVFGTESTITLQRKRVNL